MLFPTEADSAVRRCVGSNCTRAADGTDDCGPGETCLLWADTERPIHRCAPAGMRGWGEPCENGIPNVETRCKKGLQCLGDFCLPTSCESDEDCGKGGVCRKMMGGGMECIPGCGVDDDCPAGYRCANWSDRGGRQCIAASAEVTCMEEGCLDPLDECLVRDGSTYHPEADCVRPCETDEGCPSGQFCLLGREIPGVPGFVTSSICREDCQPGGCPEGQTCHSVDDGSHHAVCGFDENVDIRELMNRRFSEFLEKRATSELAPGSSP